MNYAVVAFVESRFDADADRLPIVRALFLDGTLFVREGRWRTEWWSTPLGDIDPDLDSAAATAWLANRDPEWLNRIRA